MMKLMRLKPRQDQRISKYKEFLTHVFTDRKELFDRYNVKLKQGKAELVLPKPYLLVVFIV